MVYKVYNYYIDKEIINKKEIKNICSALDISEADKIRIWLLEDIIQIELFKYIGKDINREPIYIKYDEYEQKLYKSTFYTPTLLLWVKNSKIVYNQQNIKQKEKLYKKYQRWTEKHKEKIIKEALLTIERATHQ